MRDLALELLDFVDDVVDDLGSRWAVEYVHTRSAGRHERGSAARGLPRDRRSDGCRSRHRRADETRLKGNEAGEMRWSVSGEDGMEE